MPQDDAEFSSQYKVVIQPKSFKDYWKSLWSFREILYILARRDVVVRYKQTVIGLVWTLIKPLLTMIAFTIVFSKIADLPDTGMPYPVLVLAGLLPWYFFSGTLSEMGNSIVNNQSMVSKIYFPRLLLPFSTITVGLIDLVIALLLLFGLMLFYGMTFSLTLLLIPVFTVFCALACIGPGLFFAGLNVKYRDVRIVIPFIIQFGLYISPVGFSSTLVSEKFQMLYAINPMVSVIDGFRWCISGGETAIYWSGFGVSAAVTTFMLVFGLCYFRRVEKGFADLI